MIESALNLVDRYKHRGVLIDTNLLVLLLVGHVSPDHVPEFKRTRQYSKEDHVVLDSLLSKFSRIVTTPNVLTEVGNLANALSGKYRADFPRIFSAYIQRTLEEYVPSQEICETAEFARFGLADTCILEACKSGLLLMSDDFPLVGYAKSVGLDAFNFNNVRGEILAHAS